MCIRDSINAEYGEVAQHPMAIAHGVQQRCSIPLAGGAADDWEERVEWFDNDPPTPKAPGGCAPDSSILFQSISSIIDQPYMPCLEVEFKLPSAVHRLCPPTT
eukprot:TRINITY_DN4740_c0_g1_i2.p2 TRINITY_DN4740_c0_g1~~TRINITY_DN4740_c0_g1_i2.p2  ORF type:complete len:103 (+),score=22.97 TRINITY_DN4740_c0_g1_i2:164-472(+)